MVSVYIFICIVQDVSLCSTLIADRDFDLTVPVTVKVLIRLGV